MKIEVRLAGQDAIAAIRENSGGDSPVAASPPTLTIHATGCAAFLAAVSALIKTAGDPAAWPLPAGHSHVDLLLREFILRLRGHWEFPVIDEETCHCRNVSTERIDRAIMNGAHTTAEVSRETSASTSCGTCRPVVQLMIDYRLGRLSSDAKKSTLQR
ncbi:MAG: nitrite reductase [Bdellovibrio sp.]|nr:MAG: nitrite reductase [Bdellovibrio sp.]